MTVNRSLLNYVHSLESLRQAVNTLIESKNNDQIDRAMICLKHAYDSSNISPEDRMNALEYNKKTRIRKIK